MEISRNAFGPIGSLNRMMDNSGIPGKINRAATETCFLTGRYIKATVCVVFVLLVFGGHSLAVPCNYALSGDLNHDCKVNLLDLSMMAANWLIDCNQLPLDPACIDNTLILQRAQEAQFHYLEIGIQIYRTEFGTYPPSTNNADVSFPAELGDDPNTYLGANKLTEAMVGMDLLGFHPRSMFRSNGLGYIPDGYGGFEVGLVYAGTPENFAERKGPFISTDDGGIFKLEDIYEDVSSFNGSNFVLCDVFEKERHSGKKTGMPILYFRARTNYYEQDYTNGIENDIFYYPDNQALLELGSADDQSVPHPLSDGIDDWQDFENMILNKNITAMKRPYRADSYILISAGYDGLYGTSDDLFNFTPE